MPGYSNDTIAAARQRTRIHQRMCHSDTNAATACVISRQSSVPFGRRGGVKYPAGAGPLGRGLLALRGRRLRGCAGLVPAGAGRKIGGAAAC
jgi:hypothetical protein